jgi:hypothetical protein
MWGRLLTCGGLAIRLPHFAGKAASAGWLVAHRSGGLTNPPQIANQSSWPCAPPKAIENPVRTRSLVFRHVAGVSTVPHKGFVPIPKNV